jgi:hypothetical protein
MDERPRHRRFRFGLRTLFELIAVVAFVLTLIYYRTTAIDNTGRFLVPHTDGRSGVVVDTQTGHLWRWSAGGYWYDEGEPTPPK